MSVRKNPVAKMPSAGIYPVDTNVTVTLGVLEIQVKDVSVKT